MTEARDKADSVPIPDASVLRNWKVKNSSAPFDEDAAIRYLSRTEDALDQSFRRIITSALGPSKP